MVTRPFVKLKSPLKKKITYLGQIYNTMLKTHT